VYILECADGTYYTGVTGSLELRLGQHQTGHDPTSFTFRRRPVTLVWTEAFPTEQQARERERQLKGWSKAKKKALIQAGMTGVQAVVRAEHGREGVARRRPKSKEQG
jgi:predicted GIY-YIG superfamily endonuclease